MRDNLDPTNSLSTQFTLRNGNIVPLENVAVRVNFNEFALVHGATLSNVSMTFPNWRTEYLGVDEGLTVDFTNTVGCGGECPITTADISIIVDYAPWFLPLQRTKTFRFIARKRPNSAGWAWQERPAK